MTPAVQQKPSKTQTDKAGAVLRSCLLGPANIEITDEIAAAFQVIWGYRAAFSYPLTKLNNNLRYYVKKESPEVLVSQRLKRLPRIISKLIRFPKMRLTQMQDVGGVRAILPDQEAIYALYQRIAKNWKVITVDDYISSPKATGYRALHVIVKRDELPFEVQLRTPGQQDWADEIERIDGRLRSSVKDGEGPSNVLTYTRALAEVIAESEAGVPITPTRADELANLRRYVP